MLQVTESLERYGKIYVRNPSKPEISTGHQHQITKEVYMYTVKAKEKPKWYQFRWKFSNMLVKVARSIYPENPEVTAFIMQQITDQMIYGRSITRIDPKDYFKEAAHE